MNNKIHHKFKVGPKDNLTLVDLLHEKTGMSKSRLKVVLTRGGVWLGRKKRLRVRRATSQVMVGDVLEVYDDPKLENADVSQVYALEDKEHFGVWYKPANVFSQGTPYGDEGSMLRLLEKNKPQVYLIHRLDRETAGVMLFAYNKKAAATLSEQFSSGLMEKVYQAEVLGVMATSFGIINQPLEGKEALTHYQVVEKRERSTLVQIEIETGRLHQIRKHFEMIGHPVLGDSKYGKGNKDPRGLQLIASRITVPWTFKEPKVYELPPELCLF